MKMKKIVKVAMIILAAITLTFTSFSAYQIHLLKKICFYNYNAKDFMSADRDFEKLGFKYEGSFDEERERKIMFENMSIFFYGAEQYKTENKDYVVLSFKQNGHLKKYLEKILSKYYAGEIQENSFPDFLKYMSDISCYKHGNRFLYLGNYSPISHLLIEFNHENP